MTTALRLLMRSFTTQTQATRGGRLPVSRRNFSSSQVIEETNEEWHRKREKALHNFWSVVITLCGGLVIGLSKAELNEWKEKGSKQPTAESVRESLEFLESGEKDTSESEALLMIKSKLGMEDNTDGLKDDVAYLKRAMEVLLLINRVDPVTLQPPLTRTEDVSSAPSPHS
ncbi:unnamed protein product [Microthlaspi erraticum]|uniref:Uncharacterized protein n=1 Tax=Microthlaspi erraticum TaxID=1685480 RepID=A0A6D2I112_9BRAS|nr:unnamed protein product [Microthlaspi erraticum]